MIIRRDSKPDEKNIIFTTFYKMSLKYFIFISIVKVAACLKIEYVRRCELNRTIDKNHDEWDEINMFCVIE